MTAELNGAAQVWKYYEVWKVLIWFSDYENNGILARTENRIILPNMDSSKIVMEFY